MIALPTYEERLDYIYNPQEVATRKYPHLRKLIESIYKSDRFKEIRARVIARDNGFDLGAIDHPIEGRKIIVHHINPLTEEDYLTNSDAIYDMENLVSVSHGTHQMIHYGYDPTVNLHNERTPGDTKLW